MSLLAPSSIRIGSHRIASSPEVLPARMRMYLSCDWLGRRFQRVPLQWKEHPRPCKGREESPGTETSANEAAPGARAQTPWWSGSRLLSASNSSCLLHSGEG
eukprot:scaffold7064_cov253-Pinguiococcus_pyrenoidosus.AAC.1